MNCEKKQKMRRESPNLQTTHRIYLDSAECIIYSTLESWFTNLEQTPLNRCQQLPGPNKRLINEMSM